MWVCKIEVWPYGNHNAPEEVLKLVAANDETGTWERGNYKIIDGTGTPDQHCRRALLDSWDNPDLRATGWPRGAKGDGHGQGHLPDLVASAITAIGLDVPRIIYTQ